MHGKGEKRKDSKALDSPVQSGNRKGSTMEVASSRKGSTMMDLLAVNRKGSAATVEANHSKGEVDAVAA